MELILCDLYGEPIGRSWDAEPSLCSLITFLLEIPRIDINLPPRVLNLQWGGSQSSEHHKVTARRMRRSL